MYIGVFQSYGQKFHIAPGWLVPFQLTITIWITSAPLNCTIWSDPACPFSIPTQFVSCYTNQFTSGLVIVVALTALDHTVWGNWKLVTRSYYEEEPNTRTFSTAKSNKFFYISYSQAVLKEYLPKSPKGSKKVEQIFAYAKIGISFYCLY